MICIPPFHARSRDLGLGMTIASNSNHLLVLRTLSHRLKKENSKSQSKFKNEIQKSAIDFKFYVDNLFSFVLDFEFGLLDRKKEKKKKKRNPGFSAARSRPGMTGESKGRSKAPHEAESRFNYGLGKRVRSGGN